MLRVQSHRTLVGIRHAEARLWRKIREAQMLRAEFLGPESDELTRYGDELKEIEDQFIRLSVEIAGEAMGFGRPEEHFLRQLHL
jgi:hypothetical protein